MESWRMVWRKAITPIMSVPALEALKKGLEDDDPRIMQGAISKPPPLHCTQGWPVEAACALGYCGWQGEGLGTVNEVSNFFAQLCYEIDCRMGEPAACRYFLNWFDETEREEMRILLLAEVVRSIKVKNNGEQHVVCSPLPT